MNSSSLTSKTINVVKFFFFCFLGVVFIVASSILLRKLCLPTVKATEKEYVHILAPTPLYKTSDCDMVLITLPEGYYATVLNKTDQLVRVEYNSITGFLYLSDNAELTQTSLTDPYQTAEIKTASDSGTHLRVLPSTSSSTLTTIPANSTLTYIGEISGERPSDGTSETWFYVHYDSGATTTHTGYVYSERIDIISGKVERPISSTTPSSTTSTPPPTGEELMAPMTTTPISAGLKIFLTILFSTLGIIIFALLIISPREKKESHPKRSHSKSESYLKIDEKDNNFRNKNGDFVPKNAQKLTISPKNLQNEANFTSSNKEYNQKSTQKTAKSNTTFDNIQSQNAKNTNLTQKNTKNTTFDTQNSLSSWQNNKKLASTEFSNFLDFDQPTYHHRQQSHSSKVLHERPRKKNLHLIGEKEGSPLPRVLQRYFDLED